LQADGIDYLGFLYAGLMITQDGTPKVLEFNCRFGDPETQPIMARLKTDLVELCLAAIDGKLANKSIEWDPRAALGVVMAAGGYPKNYRKGDRIDGLPDVIGIQGKVFHAGTTMQGDDVVTNGGRVLCVVGLGDTVAEARDVAYARTEQISWDNHFFRRDIGHRAIAREK
jgi:phosphoribosylamine--glycine ligase